MDIYFKIISALWTINYGINAPIRFQVQTGIVGQEANGGCALVAKTHAIAMIDRVVCQHLGRLQSFRLYSYHRVHS